MGNRNNKIDILRGIGIILIILVHVAAWHRGDPIANWLWNYSQFAVQLFVFCSGYIFYVKESVKPIILSPSYFWKRIVRLMLPYYAFLIVYLPVEFLEDGKRMNLPYVLKSLTLTGGTDLNWPVLLFIMFAVVSPVVLFLLNKQRFLFWLYVLMATSSSLLFLNYKIEFLNYKLIMWLPWSLLILAAWLFFKKSHRLFILSIFILSSFATLLLSQYLASTGHSLVFFNNKYPPNLYFLLYGLSWIAGLWIVLDFLKPDAKIWNTVSFFGRYSYTLYFIHFWIWIILRVVIKPDIHWSLQFFIVLSLSGLIQLSLNKRS